MGVGVVWGYPWGSGLGGGIIFFCWVVVAMSEAAWRERIKNYPTPTKTRVVKTGIDPAVVHITREALSIH